MANPTHGTSTQHPDTAQPGDGVDISVRRARGAFPGRHVLLMLVASLALVIIAFIVAFATNPTTPVADKAGSAKVEQSSAAQQFNVPANDSPTPSLQPQTAQPTDATSRLQAEQGKSPTGQ